MKSRARPLKSPMCGVQVLRNARMVAIPVPVASMMMSVSGLWMTSTWSLRKRGDLDAIDLLQPAGHFLHVQKGVLEVQELVKVPI